MKGWIYIAADGSYGSAEDILLLEERYITSQEWEELEDEGDRTRLKYGNELAQRIAERRIRDQKDRRY